MTTNPHMLPKVRSESLKQACRHMPCTLRIASFVGIACASQDTVVPCHIETIGKGTSTKVSDLFIAAGCAHCHDIIDRRNMKALELISERYPAAFADRLMRGNHETIARWVGMGLITGSDWEIV